MRIDWKTFTKHWTRPKPNQFPTGTRVYKGFQGSGKTLSMVKYALDILEAFPKCHLYSNIKIKHDKSQLIENTNHLKRALEDQNGEDGVLILLDEAHLFFNKKTGISLDVLTAISQQRKDRKRLVFSSQIWEELDISLRKQVKEVVSCRCAFQKLQINTLQDGEKLTYDKLEGAYIAPKIRTEIWKHNDQLYDVYDTYQKITTNDDYKREFSAVHNATFAVGGYGRGKRR